MAMCKTPVRRASTQNCKNQPSVIQTDTRQFYFNGSAFAFFEIQFDIDLVIDALPCVLQFAYEKISEQPIVHLLSDDH